MSEQKTKVAIQGIHASFHEEAALKYFGKDIEIVPCDNFKLTFEALKHQKAAYAVMAIENSIAGSLLPNYNLLRDYNYGIVGEVYLNIQLHLMALPGVKLEDIETVISHPIAIRQCNDFFDENPQFQVVESNDTAACAKKIQDQQLTKTAAIANHLAAKTYCLNKLAERIETHKKNYTRFLVIKIEKNPEAKQPNKASICFQAGNQVGSLAKVLNIFAENELNLSKIQSMPVLGKRNEYIFYIDIEWTNTQHYEKAITLALKHTINFNIMGEYLKNDKV